MSLHFLSFLLFSPPKSFQQLPASSPPSLRARSPFQWDCHAPRQVKAHHLFPATNTKKPTEERQSSNSSKGGRPPAAPAPLVVARRLRLIGLLLRQQCPPLWLVVHASQTCQRGETKSVCRPGRFVFRQAPLRAFPRASVWCAKCSGGPVRAGCTLPVLRGGCISRSGRSRCGFSHSTKTRAPQSPLLRA